MSDGQDLKPGVIRIVEIEAAVTASDTVVEGQSDHGRLGGGQRLKDEGRKMQRQGSSSFLRPSAMAGQRTEAGRRMPGKNFFWLFAT